VREPVVFRVDSTTASLHTEYNGVADSLYQLQLGVELALFFASKTGGKTGDVAGDVDRLLKLPACFDAVKDGDGGAILDKCLGVDEIAETGLAGAYLATLMFVGPVIEYFHSRANLTIDLFNHRDQYDIRFGSTQSTPSGRTLTCHALDQLDGDVLHWTVQYDGPAGTVFDNARDYYVLYGQSGPPAYPTHETGVLVPGQSIVIDVVYAPPPPPEGTVYVIALGALPDYPSDITLVGSCLRH
jgi:hypothetical protein